MNIDGNLQFWEWIMIDGLKCVSELRRLYLSLSERERGRQGKRERVHIWTHTRRFCCTNLLWEGCRAPALPSLLSTVSSSLWDSLATSRSLGHFAPPNAPAMCQTSSCRAWRWEMFYCWWPAPRWMPAVTWQRSGCSGERAVKSSPSSSSLPSGCLCSLWRHCPLTGRLLTSSWQGRITVTAILKRTLFFSFFLSACLVLVQSVW